MRVRMPNTPSIAVRINIFQLIQTGVSIALHVYIPLHVWNLSLIIIILCLQVWNLILFKQWITHGLKLKLCSKDESLTSVSLPLSTRVKDHWMSRKTNKMAYAPSKDSDQPGHPLSLIRVFAVRMKKVCDFSYPLSAQRRLWSHCAHMPFPWFCHEAAHF